MYENSIDLCWISLLFYFYLFFLSNVRKIFIIFFILQMLNCCFFAVTRCWEQHLLRCYILKHHIVLFFMFSFLNFLFKKCQKRFRKFLLYHISDCLFLVCRYLIIYFVFCLFIIIIVGWMLFEWNYLRKK